MSDPTAPACDPVDLVASLLPATWRSERGHDDFWVFATPTHPTPLPLQGWKLHVTADTENYEHTLRAAVPVLVDLQVQFKACATVDRLGGLNAGLAGATQVGKFITVYAGDDHTAVTAADRLDRALRGSTGPLVPSDRPLHADSVVSYRYGAFSSRWIQSPFGLVSQGIEDPDGQMVADERDASKAVPAWLDDPFRAAGIARDLPPPPQWIADRFRVLAVLERSPRGAVYLAIDGQGLQRCVLKVARRGGGVHESAARLQREAGVLAQLSHVPAVVRMLAFEHTATDQILALEDLGGSSLERVMGGALASNRAPLDEAVAAVQSLADTVAELHRVGMVHRDVKPSNAMRTPDGATRLFDLEMACGAGEPAYGIGTTGYASPQQRARAEAHPADDVYSLGRSAARLVCSLDVTALPDGDALATYVRSACLDLSDEVIDVMQRATHPDRSARQADAGEFAASWRSASTTPRTSPAYGSLGATHDIDRAAHKVHQYADALVADSTLTDEGRAWVSRAPGSPGIALRDLANGGAGAVTALVAMAAFTGDASHRGAVADGARWLMAAPRFEGPPLGGLYVGDAGVLLALCRAGVFLGDDRILQHAARLVDDLAQMPVTGPDLYNGAAGRCRALLRAGDLLGSSTAIEFATKVGDHLLRVATVDDSGMRWVAPGDDLPSGDIGYAHGAAGIGDVLLELGDRGDRRFIDAAVAAARWVMRWQVDGGDAVAFPATSGNGPWSPHWCHGATGVGRFLLRLHERQLLDDPTVLRRIAHGTARLGRFGSPALCHGLGSAVDHLIDQHRVTGDAAHLDEAWGLTPLFEAFERVGDDGRLRSLTEVGPTPTFDLSTGYLGAAISWLRLADPELPTLID